MRMRPRVPLLVLAASLALTAIGCGEGGPNSGGDGGRVLVLAMDGLDPATLDLLLAEGELPNFARLRRHGAYGRLQSQRPLLSPIVWTTVATGKTPDVHGISHFVATDPATGERIPVTREMRRVKAVWNHVSEAGHQVLVVGWWATWPPEEVRGSIVSDHTAYHFLFEEGLAGKLQGDETYPPALLDEVRPLLTAPDELDPDWLARFVDGSATTDGDDGTMRFDEDLSHLRWALAAARSYSRIGLELWREEDPRLGMVYVEATDSVAHLFGHLFRRDDLVGELAEQQSRFGDTVEEVYRYADEILGEYLEAVDSDTTLVVLSDHGFELGALHDDPSRARDLRRVSERFHREHGVLYLYGNRVHTGRRLEGASILDVAPTLLALAGLPAGRDMPGRVLSEALRFEAPERIASWEGDAPLEAPKLSRDRDVEQATLERLRSLGYLSGSDEAEPSPAGPEAGRSDASSPGSVAVPSDAGLRNMAAIQFEAGNLEEALELYGRLVAADPADAGLRTSLAGVLGALGRLPEARAEIDRALELDPLNVEAYHNRGVVEERLGNRDRAIADYRTALRYAPDYEPSGRALLRLGAERTERELTAAELEAAALCEEAADLARRGDYDSALERLDRAAGIAPRLATVYQYRSNVAYLAGDLEGAIAALEEGLALEPDNALFARNLAGLRQQLGER